MDLVSLTYDPKVFVAIKTPSQRCISVTPEFFVCITEAEAHYLPPHATEPETTKEDAHMQGANNVE